MYKAIMFLIKLLVLAGAAACSAFFVIRKERIFKPKPRKPEADTGVTVESEAKARSDEEFISGQESKLANLLTVLCRRVARNYGNTNVS